MERGNIYFYMRDLTRHLLRLQFPRVFTSLEKMGGSGSWVVWFFYWEGITIYTRFTVVAGQVSFFWRWKKWLTEKKTCFMRKIAHHAHFVILWWRVFSGIFNFDGEMLWLEIIEGCFRIFWLGFLLYIFYIWVIFYGHIWIWVDGQIGWGWNT